MKVVVLVKEVPDTYGARSMTLETGLVDREASDRVNDEIGERALEAAITLQETMPDVTIVVISMGPDSVETSLRKALAIGADEAVHIVDDALIGADLGLTAEVLSRAIAKQSADLVIAGNVSTDGNGSVVPAMIAEHLGLAQATNLASLEVVDGTLTGVRAADGVSAHVEARLPAIVSITEAMPDPRMPGFKGLIAAKKKPLTRVSAAELDADVFGELAGRAIVIAAAERPPRAAGTTISDEGDAGTRLAEFLVAKGLA